jgi:uncharacterized protein (DUF934 family)
MALWRDGAFAENSWTTLVDDAPAPPSGAILVSLSRWRQEREALADRADFVGVEIVRWSRCASINSRMDARFPTRSCCANAMVSRVTCVGLATCCSMSCR